MENKINIGELDTLVTVLSVVQTIGTQGEKTLTSSEYGQVWASVEHSYGEGVNDYNLDAGDSMSLTIYKIPAMTIRWRIAVDGVTYGISAIDMISRRSRFMRVTLKAIE